MTLPAVLAILLPSLLVFVLVRLVPVLREPSASRWGRVLVAVAAYSLGLYLFGQYGLDRAGSLELELNETLAGQYQVFRQHAETVAGETGITVPLGVENRWDVDDYQRPLGLITGAGEVDAAAMDAQLEARRGFLSNAVWGNWISGLVLLLFIALGYGQRVWRTLVEHRDAYLYVTPAMLGMLLLVMFPFAYGVALSFTDMTLFNENLPLRDLWVGLKNYVDVLGDFNIASRTDDGWIFNYKNFYWTLYITICWTVFNVAIGVSVGLVLALALNTKGLRGKSIYRILLILPWAVPNYITALTWRGMFHQQFGVINQAIQMFGGEPVAWFDGVFSSFLTGLATNGWLSFPFMMVVILGGLQSISADMYEAARVEGASRWQQFRHITLPLLKPTLIPAIIISVVWTFNMFNIIFLVSGGEPGGANEILITQAYKLAFEQYRYAYAAAYSVVIFIILLTYGVFQNKMTKATENVA
jgi:arabinogalactan oligomer/maltooligosaccharide transport system permease protein